MRGDSSTNINPMPTDILALYPMFPSSCSGVIVNIVANRIYSLGKWTCIELMSVHLEYYSILPCSVA